VEFVDILLAAVHFPGCGGGALHGGRCRGVGGRGSVLGRRQTRVGDGGVGGGGGGGGGRGDAVLGLRHPFLGRGGSLLGGRGLFLRGGGLLSSGRGLFLGLVRLFLGLYGLHPSVEGASLCSGGVPLDGGHPVNEVVDIFADGVEPVLLAAAE